MSTKERNIFGIRNQVDISYKEITGSYKYYITWPKNILKKCFLDEFWNFFRMLTFSEMLNWGSTNHFVFSNANYIQHPFSHVFNH